MFTAFKAKNIGFYVKFNESPAAKELVKHLPLGGAVHRWGDEIFFETDVAVPDEGATLDVNVGDVAFWPRGKCLCVFFGPTQASTSDKPVPASPVVIVGKTMAAPEELREIKAGEPISVFVMGSGKTFSSAKNPYEDARKLTQAEIDALVKQLLEERKHQRK